MACFQARCARRNIAFMQRDHAQRGRNFWRTRCFASQVREELLSAIERPSG